MRKVTLYQSISLDGFIAREDGDADWGYSVGDESRFVELPVVKRLMDGGRIVLMGRKAYDGAVRDSVKFYGMGLEDVLSKYNQKLYVFTKRKLDNARNVIFVSDVVETVRDLKNQKSSDGDDVIHLAGGAQLNTVLLNSGLIDGMTLVTIPICLGKGIPLFHDVDKEVNCEMVEMNQHPDSDCYVSNYKILP